MTGILFHKRNVLVLNALQLLLFLFFIPTVANAESMNLEGETTASLNLIITGDSATTLGMMNLIAKDSITSLTHYARISGAVEDNTDGSEDGELDFYVMANGVLSKIAAVTTNGLKLGAGSSSYLLPDEKGVNNQVLKMDEAGNLGWEADAGGLVDSVYGRTGDVTAQSGDYPSNYILHTPSGNISADDVEEAINELDSEKQATITGAATSIVTSNLSANSAVVTDGSGKITTSSVTSEQIGFLSGVSSSIQTQIDNKQDEITGGSSTDYWTGNKTWQDLDSTVTGLGYLKSVSTPNLQQVTDAGNTTSHTLYTSGVQVTGNIYATGTITGPNLSGTNTGDQEWGDITGTISDQTDLQNELDDKQDTITGAATTIVSTNLSLNKAVISDGSGKVAASSVTSTELGYVSGVTSSLQTQINGKSDTSHNHDSSYVNVNGDSMTGNLDMQNNTIYDAGSIGVNIIYDPDDGTLVVSDNLLCSAIDTGYGAKEIGQNLRTSDSPSFAGMTITGQNSVIIDGHLKAEDSGGIGLKDDGGNLGIWVEDGGHVGVGTASPSVPLEVASPSSSMPTIKLGRYSGNPNIKSSDSYLIMDSNGGRAALNWYTSNDVVLAYGGGKVGIGASTPSGYDDQADNLVIYESGSSAAAGITIHSGTSGAGTVYFGDSSSGDASRKGGMAYAHNSNLLFLFADYDSTSYPYWFFASTGAIEIPTCQSAPSASSGFSKIFASGTGSYTAMKIQNASGSSFTISPHDFWAFQPDLDDTLPYCIEGRNCFIGKRINVDHSGLMLAMEQMYNDYYGTSRQFVFIEDLPAEEVVDYSTWQTSETLRLIVEAKQKICETDPWIETTLLEATEEIAEMTEQIDVQTVTKYRLNPETGLVESYEIEEEVRTLVPTGYTKYQIKKDYRLDENTGIFYRKRTPDDVTLDKATLDAIDDQVQLPDYVVERLPK